MNERDYLAYDPFDGDRDVDIRCRTVKLVRARKEYQCYCGAAIKRGELYRYEVALIDREFWGKYRACLPCIDKWLEE
jgi:hypothetical protein